MSRKAQRAYAPRLERDQRIGDILVAARDVFCEKGFEPAAVSEIAARVGVAEGTVFKYFATKRDLLLKVLEHWYEEMFGDCERTLQGVSGTRARLRLLIWRHLLAVRDYPLLCRLMFREVRSEQDYQGSKLHEMNRHYTHYLMDVIGEGVEAGEFRGDLPVTLLRDLVYGGIEHHAWNYVCGRGEIDIETLADQLLSVLCEGIALRASASSTLQEERLSRIADRLESLLPRTPGG